MERAEEWVEMQDDRKGGIHDRRKNEEGGGKKVRDGGKREKKWEQT